MGEHVVEVDQQVLAHRVGTDQDAPIEPGRASEASLRAA